MNDRYWNAFCTVHWFLTGEQIICESKHEYTDILLDWFVWRF